MSTLYSYQDSQIKFIHAIDERPRDEDFQMHIHEQYEIFYFISGDATFLVEGNEYPLEPGSIFTLGKTETHRIRILGSEPYERFTLHFFPALLDSIDPGHLLLRPFDDHPLGHRNLYRPSEFRNEQPLALLKAMCVTGDTEEQRLAVISNMFPLLNLLRVHFLKKPEETAPRGLAEEIVAYVNLHLFEELSVDGLCGRFFLSASQFRRLFKQATGSSVWDYIIIKRLLAARNMIRAGESLSKAAHDCGFRDYSSFYRAYVHKYKVSPKNDLLDGEESQEKS